MKRIAYIIQEYPQISQTYVHEEITSLNPYYEIKVFSWKKPDLPRKNHHPFELCSSPQDLFQKVKAFQPNFLHAHYLHQIIILEGLANQLQIPYTLRTHSFDILKPPAEKLMQLLKFTHSPKCARVLCFPDFKERLISLGLAKEKAFASWPVVNIPKFFNPEPPTQKKRIMNVGAALDKKNYNGFIDLAALMRNSGYTFNLYVMGYEKDKLIDYNLQLSSPVHTIISREPEEMPAVYREHDWLVYTGDPAINTLGLPMALAEAQASGIGVCMQEMPGRVEALSNYMGGAGYLFKNINELPAILAKPYPEEMRLKGLENCKKCDINVSNILLREIWDSF